MTFFGRKLPCGPRRAAIVLCVGFVACAPPAMAATRSVWELTPYRIQLIVAVEQVTKLPAGLQAELQQELIARIDSVVGTPWDVTPAVPSQALKRLLVSDIEMVAVESLPEESLEFDKVMLVSVTTAPPGYRVHSRELDVRTRVFGTTVSRPVWQAEKLRDVAFGAIWKAFAPLAQIENTKGSLVTLRLRAAGLESRDKTLPWVGVGDVFRPLVRYNDRHGNIRRIAQIPWTFLVVDKVAADQLQCKLYSGLRSPLSGRRRGRLEQLALAVIPPHGSTRLTLRCRTKPKQALAGYSVYVGTPGSKAKRLLGRTDYQGDITVPPSEHPLSILTVASGGRPLARLPIVPGMEPHLKAAVVDDDQRLEAEGFVTGLQESLVDLVARREVLMALAEKQLDDGRFAEAGAVIRQLRQLQTRDQFGRMLNTQQKKIFSDDPAVQRKIDALFADTRKQLRQYVDPEPIDRLAKRLSGFRGQGAGVRGQGQDFRENVELQVLNPDP